MSAHSSPLQPPTPLARLFARPLCLKLIVQGPPTVHYGAPPSVGVENEDGELGFQVSYDMASPGKASPFPGLGQLAVLLQPGAQVRQYSAPYLTTQPP
jgi:hypothetical protein